MKALILTTPLALFLAMVLLGPAAQSGGAAEPDVAAESGLTAESGVAADSSRPLTGREIMEMVDARDDGDNMTSRMEMILIDKKGHQRTRQIRSFTKDKGDDVLKLMFFLSPADVEGTGFLTYDYHSGEKDDDQWLYLPELKKVKRIASSDKSSSFMGSDFSYADMTRRVLDEWTYELLKDGEVRGARVWIVEALPAGKEIEDRYGYSKSVLFIRQDNYMIARAVHWLKDGGKLKYLDVTGMDQIDGIWVASELNMKTVKNKQTLHRTVLKIDEVRFGQDLDEEMFSTRRLEKGL